MAIYKFPEEGEREKPEFIVIDEPEEADAGGFAAHSFVSALRDIQNVSYPWSVRVLSFVGAAFALLVVVPIGVAVFFWGIAALLGFLKFPQLNAMFDKLYGLFKKLVVVIIGLLIAVFNPTLGIGLIILRFLIAGEELPGVMTRVTSWQKPQN